ncbi:hypothetical protein OG943_04940 [Amycolatopsis sp. NBC_00345]|uniref:hypothetical protein n=1 Tax=Amycolatopsis sp. NBC_00345 TaxID=2975955 RepID=UPI002E2576CD
MPGWARVSDRGERSDYPRRAVIPVRSDMDCRTGHPEYAPSSMLCAGKPDVYTRVSTYANDIAAQASLR